MDRITDTGGLEGVAVDYLDGVVFSPHESYLCLGILTDNPGAVSELHRPADLLPLDPARQRHHR